MTCHCRRGADDPVRAAAPTQPTLRRRLRAAAGWAAPAVTLLLIPKCPACLAAYVALWTGLGLSFHTAAYIRTGLLVLCVASLCLLGVGQIRRFLRRAAAAR